MKLLHLVALCLFVCFGCVTCAASAEPLHVGMAEVDITPPLGFPMAGYYDLRLATGQKDPLKARALVIRQGETRVALVTCDLTGIAHDLSTEIRRLVLEKTGIPVSNTIVTATHSHTAPDYTKDLYLHLTEETTGKSGKAEPRYSARLIAAAVEAIVQANAAAQPVRVESGKATQVTPVSFNRRFVMRDGSVKTWMNHSNPDVVKAAGPIDPEIGMVHFRQADQATSVGLLSSFALHLDTVGGLEWSADYPYYIERHVRRKLGDQAVSLFGLGCCGDINHSDPNASVRNKTDFIGGALGETIAAGLADLRPLKSPILQVRATTVALPLGEVSRAEAQRATELIALARKGTRVDFFEHVTAYKHLILDELRHASPFVKTDDHITWGLSKSWAGIGEALPVDVQVFTLGSEVAVVCLPGEVFVELGTAIKRASPFETTLVIELSQCVETAYIPTSAAYAGGSYEVTNSFVKPGAGEKLVEAAVSLLRDAASATQKQLATVSAN